MQDDRDREAWYRLLQDVERRFGWKLHAWVLLDNHFHLLVETHQPLLSAGMQRLNGLHAARFNRRYDRAGHLFQGRFESRVVDSEEYLGTVSEYIYENATRVGLRGWPWRELRLSQRAEDRARASCDYALERRHDRGDATQRAPRGRNRSPQRRRRGPPRRRAGSLQRSRGSQGPAGGLLGAAGAARRRSGRGRLRGLDRARCADRGSHETRESQRVPARLTRASRRTGPSRSPGSTSTSPCTTRSSRRSTLRSAPDGRSIDREPTRGFEPRTPSLRVKCSTS